MNKANKIVVVGGSFNPPTIAHKRIQPEGIENISSTLARKLINEKDKALNNILDSKVVNFIYSI